MKVYDRKKLINIITVVLAVILFLIWVFLAVIELESVKDAGAYDERVGTKYIAHRGYSCLYFENTAEAFEAAASSRFFQAVETDVWMTADGVYVCCHNENPFRDKSIKVTKKTYDEIKDLPLDLSTAGPDVDLSIEYRICPLSVYLNMCNSYRKTAVIEIKQKFNKEETIALCQYILSTISSRQLIIGSFNKQVVDYAYGRYPAVTIELFSPVRILGGLYSDMGYNVGLNVKAVNKKFVEKCHKKGEFVCVYTVKDIETADKMRSLGVDYITTDGEIFGA